MLTLIISIAGKRKNLGVIASIIFFHGLVPVIVLFFVCYLLHRELRKDLKHRKGNCNNLHFCDHVIHWTTDL